MDLRDTFFCIPLHPDSQPLFVFEDPTNLVGPIDLGSSATRV
jgi:hypothetical protein